MGKPDNPLETIWPRNAGAGRFPFCGGDIRSVLGAYAILAVIHDCVLPRCPSIAKGVLPKELEGAIWRPLVTGANEEDTIIIPGVPTDKRVIPISKIDAFFENVKADIENHFAPKNGTPQKLAAKAALANLKPAETKRDIAHAEAERAGVNINIGAIQADNVQIAHRASIRKELRTQNEPTERTTWDTIWRLVKKVPAWIYFLAGLLTVLYYLGWLEPIKAYINRILR